MPCPSYRAASLTRCRSGGAFVGARGILLAPSVGHDGSRAWRRDPPAPRLRRSSSRSRGRDAGGQTLMRIRTLLIWTMLVTFGVTSPLWAEEQIADRTALAHALAAKAADDAATRAAVDRALDRQDVREAAARFG